MLTYGLVAPSVGAVTIASDGVWAAANVGFARGGGAGGADQRRGLTWVAPDLSLTRTADFSFVSSRRLLAADNQLWVATEQGVIRIDQATLRSRTWDLQDVTSLARTSEGVWVGTTHGLSIIRSNDLLDDLASSGVAILSLLADGDTLWVGTSGGLGHVLPGSDAITIPAGLGERATLRVPVYALAGVRDTIVMATGQQLVWRSPGMQEWSAITLPPSLGRPTALTVGPDATLWVGGTLGLAQAELASGLVHVHPVPFEVPAAIRDLAADRSYLWAATDSGLMRIQ